MNLSGLRNKCPSIKVELDLNSRIRVLWDALFMPVRTFRQRWLYKTIGWLQDSQVRIPVSRRQRMTRIATIPTSRVNSQARSQLMSGMNWVHINPSPLQCTVLGQKCCKYYKALKQIGLSWRIIDLLTRLWRYDYKKINLYDNYAIFLNSTNKINI